MYVGHKTMPVDIFTITVDRYVLIIMCINTEIICRRRRYRVDGVGTAAYNILRRSHAALQHSGRSLQNYNIIIYAFRGRKKLRVPISDERYVLYIREHKLAHIREHALIYSIFIMNCDIRTDVRVRHVKRCRYNNI